LFYLIASHYGFIQYWHFVLVASLLGLVSTIEMPTRQSMISRVVPADDLSSAVPLAGMTFNLARVIGPTIGGALLAAFGPQACFATNAVTYFALILAIIGIRASLAASPQEPQPIGDLLFEGMRYTFRERRLRTLFILEGIVAIFGLFYLSLMPAIAKKMLGLDKQGLGFAMTTVGVGAIVALLTLAMLKDRPNRAKLIKISMSVVGVALVVLGYTSSPFIAFPMLALVGMGTICQFNTTNTLFQLLSPEHLRGRVLAMHIWALSGLSPVGLLLFGYIAKQIPDRLQSMWVGIQASLLTVPGFGHLTSTLAGAAVSETGLPLALKIGGFGALGGAIWSWLDRKGLDGVP
jgi:MFS family permease